MTAKSGDAPEYRFIWRSRQEHREQSVLVRTRHIDIVDLTGLIAIPVRQRNPLRSARRLVNFGNSVSGVNRPFRSSVGHRNLFFAALTAARRAFRGSRQKR